MSNKKADGIVAIAESLNRSDFWPRLDEAMRQSSSILREQLSTLGYVVNGDNLTAILDHFASEYGWNSEHVSKLTDKQIIAYLDRAIQKRINEMKWTEPMNVRDLGKLCGWERTKTAEMVKKWRADGLVKGSRQSVQIPVQLLDQHKAEK